MSYVILNGMNEDDDFIPNINNILTEQFQQKNYKGDTLNLHENEIKSCWVVMKKPYEVCYL